MKRKKIELQNLVWKEGKYYVSRCLNVEVSSFGKTKADAIKNLKEALSLYFEDIKPQSALRVERPAIVSQTLEYV